MAEKLKLNFSTILFLASLLILSSCGGGGGGGGGGIIIDSMTIDMSPLRVVGYNDDGAFGPDPLHPLVYVGDIPNGKSLLMRVRDPYGIGDFYSIQTRNGYGGNPPPGTPTADEGEPDNDPIDASVLAEGVYLHRGLNPLFDEDWFSSTSSGPSWAWTMSNLSGTLADPILEVYDPTPNLGPVTYTADSAPVGGTTTLLAGVFDPTNNGTFIGMTQLEEGPGMFIDINSFFIAFSSPTTPGDFAVEFAGPPFPSDAPGSVTGSIHIDQYDAEGGRIIGSFDITIIDVSRTTTVAGSFNVTRIADEPGLLTGLKPSSGRATVISRQNALKGISAYMRND